MHDLPKGRIIRIGKRHIEGDMTKPIHDVHGHIVELDAMRQLFGE